MAVVPSKVKESLGQSISELTRSLMRSEYDVCQSSSERAWKKVYESRLPQLRKALGEEGLRSIRENSVQPCFSFLSETGQDASRYRRDVEDRLGRVTEKIDEMAKSVRQCLKGFQRGALSGDLLEEKFLAFTQDLLMDLENKRRSVFVIRGHIQDTQSLAFLHDALASPMVALEEASRFVVLVSDGLTGDRP